MSKSVPNDLHFVLVTPVLTREARNRTKGNLNGCSVNARLSPIVSKKAENSTHSIQSTGKTSVVKDISRSLQTCGGPPNLEH